MDTVSQLVNNVRNAYVKEKLTENIKFKDSAICILAKSTKTPILEQIKINGEDESLKDNMQNNIENIGVDLICLDKGFSEIANQINTLLSNTISNINDAKGIAKKAQNVLDNVNKICGYFTSFDTIITMDKEGFTGDFGIMDDNTFCCSISQQTDVPLTIVDISGSGTDLTQESNLVDNDELSYFDYLGSEINKDVNCVIQIKSAAAFSLLKLYTEKEIEIVSVSNSVNGVIFTDLLKQNIKISGDDVLLNGNYYSLGLVGIPASYYAKIGLSSSEYLRVNKLEAQAATYATDTNLVGNNITASNITSIAVYASEYIPESFADGIYIKYVLTVNGKDYEVQPINSQRVGTKIIKYKTDGTTEDGVLAIADKITSAKLTITLTTPDQTQTPFVSNIKICLGAES